MHVKTERLAILVTSRQKRAILRRAKVLDLSVAEYVLRSAEGCRPDADDQILTALASELKRSAKEGRAALRSALAEVKATLAQMQTSTARRRRERSAAIVSAREFDRLSGAGGSLWQYLRAAPTKGVRLRIERDRSLGRLVKL